MSQTVSEISKPSLRAAPVLLACVMTLASLGLVGLGPAGTGGGVISAAHAQDAPAQTAPGYRRPPEPFQTQSTASNAEAPRYRRQPVPSLNFYGLPGLMDMPSAEMLPDAQWGTSFSWFAGQSRYNLTFQALPWLTASFRYNGIQDLAGTSFRTYYDRGFDVRARLWREGRWRPAVTVGLQDFAGTGVYASEYIVATKRFETPALSRGGVPGRLKLSAGLGWGRLGTYGAIGSLVGSRGGFQPGGTGGKLATDTWFRGDFAPFAGLEWQPNDRWGFKVEYSSDAYEAEARDSGIFERKSPLNFGLEYQASRATRLGVYYLYGSEIGVTAQIQINPKHPRMPMVVPALRPVQPRSQWVTDDAQWSQDWAASEPARREVRDRVAEALKADGLLLEAVQFSGTTVELRFRNNRYRSDALAIGRVARLIANVLPPSIETFRIVPVRAGMGLSATVLRRSDLEALEFAPAAPDALQAVAAVTDAGPTPDGSILSSELYPSFSHSISPYWAQGYFDPNRPFRLDFGIALRASYVPAPGWRIAGAINHRIWGNIAQGRASNSVLPHVRTDQALYAQYATVLANLYASRHWQPRNDVYARVTAGLLENMYGGLSGEVLWKPAASPLALGVEANYVVQRDYDQLFSFRDYKTFTGHASAYLELGKGYLMRLDAGRYLAGDYGGTFDLNRTFSNGWVVGGFFTLTDVSAADFGEGSFDKGFYFRIPLDWMLGKPSRNAFGMTVRPTQRDGGQRVNVPGRLHGAIRDAHRDSLNRQRARFWE